MSERETALKAEIQAWRVCGGGWDVGRMAVLIEDLIAALPPGDAPQTCEWQPIETAPKGIVYRRGHNAYGPKILVVEYGEVIGARWWERDDETDSCNFIVDGGRAVHPTHWMPLPAPPQEEPIRPPVEGQTP